VAASGWEEGREVMGGNKMARAGISEARFIIKALENGWEIAKPIHHAQGYDYVMRTFGGRWLTVQVKTAFQGKQGRNHDTPCLIVSLRRCNEKGARPYCEGEFDYLFVVFEDRNWMVPWEEISEIRNSITISSPRFDKFTC
jgi:hypothetical protein